MSAEKGRQNGSREASGGFVVLFAALGTGAAIFSWLEALDFDPCNTILTRGGADCVEPGIGGIAVGGICAFLGLAIASSTLRNSGGAAVSKLDRMLLGWFGLMLAVAGGAIAYAQWTVGLGFS